MVKLKDFSSLNKIEFYLILAWRNNPNIASFMKNQNVSLEEHAAFFDALKNQKTKKYFLVFDEDEPLGVIHFIDICKQSCEFGLYANPYLKGKGQILMNTLKNYAFETLKVRKITACVFKNNQKALSLYLKNGFEINKEDEQMLYLQLNNVGGGINSL
ncbi:MAG: UDP-4-amino-4,6-dideoxy-N-acetyl-beta-L-altrosamine N-acetyltransferase [Helicobacter sp.]|nr:UDP-4-amino-4,6-dideoxy-N-acetyl-beta-L-altrosamine N-acetyltransferase [Helicobacter sp.]